MKSRFSTWGAAALAFGVPWAMPGCAPQLATTSAAQAQLSTLQRQIEYLSAEAQRLHDVSDIK
ncbi:MAG TPA: hypothetical protein VMB48_02480, partial [Steroidobacteraceae bacterium]|nr:hypothetical protein [Steroidobacteraceae bacterium]